MPFGWQIYVGKGKAKGQRLMKYDYIFIDYSHQFGFCDIMVGKSCHKYIVL